MSENIYHMILQTKVDEKTNLSLAPLSDIEEVDILSSHHYYKSITLGELLFFNNS